MAKTKIEKLPTTGQVYSFPLGDGRFSACRIIADSTSTKAGKWGGNCVLAVSSSWIGIAPPSIVEPELKEVLRLTHHSWKGGPNALWMMAPVPQDFQLIGHIDPSADDKAIDANGFAGNWIALTQHTLIQWRWDHDRSALLRDDVASDAREAARRKSEAGKRTAYLKSVRLKDLIERQFFPTWKFPKRFVEESRAIMRRTVDDLIALGPNASKKARMKILQECIEGFNRLDGQSKHSIETVEREDICEEFDTIVHACGLRNEENLADRWRDW